MAKLLRYRLIMLAIAGVALLVTLGVTAIQQLVTDPIGFPDDSANERIKDEFDPRTAAFHLTEPDGTPGEKVRLVDGEYEKMRLVADQSPVFADVDADGDRDAAMVLQHDGDETDTADGGWRGVYLWLWDDGKVVPVKWRAGWEFSCSQSVDGRRMDLSSAPAVGAELPTMAAFDYAECPRGVKADPDGDGDDDVVRYPHFIGLTDGLPARHINDYLAATEACALVEADADVTLDGVEPRILPTAKSPKVSDGYTEVAVADPKRMAELYPRQGGHGYVPAKVTWPTDDVDVTGCGWVKWSRVP